MTKPGEPTGIPATISGVVSVSLSRIAITEP